MRSRSRAAFAASLMFVSSFAAAPRPSPVSAQAMSLPGSFSVSPAGAATYSIPIRVVPGTAGMVPSLTLDYNSQYGNGFVGLGWSLGGLPGISRCSKTIAQDGAVSNASFDVNDRFCLDGERLVAVSGTYGSDGTEYRTEIDGFSKVISRGSAGSGPAWFEVRTKSGQMLEFGNTADSKMLVQGSATVRVWAVSKVLDTKGNYFSVTYTNDAANGQAYPSRIDYTGNAGAGLQPYNSVQFAYASRSDSVPLYHTGVLTKTTQRLTHVRTYAGASLVSEYRLAYQQSAASGRSRLSSIQLCDGAGVCLPATSLTWQEGGPFGFSAEHTNPIGPIGGEFNSGDWNADGLIDLMAYEPLLGNSRWYVNNGIVNGAPSFTLYTNPIPALPLILFFPWTVQFGDWDGDGRIDVMKYNSVPGFNRWYVNNGIVNGTLNFTEYTDRITPTQIDGQNTFLFFGDWNGDGRTDVMWYEQPSGNNRWYVNNGIVNGTLSFTEYLNPITPTQIDAGTSLLFGDWNGDGRTDVMWYEQSSGNNRWYVNNGIVNGVLNFTEHLNRITPAQIDQGTSIFFGDWNGDGRSDLMWFDRPNGTNRWYVNSGIVNGALTFAEFLNPILPADISGGSSTYFGDWNGDGLGDITRFDNASGTSRWFTNNWAASGTLSFTATTNPINPARLSNATNVRSCCDWDGDGTSDVTWWNSSNGGNRWFANTVGKADVLTAITTGLGATISVTYKPLTDASVYTKDSGANAAQYPVNDVAGAAYVVRQVDASNGVGGTVSTQYSYTGAKSHPQGRGFLGFRQMSVKDLQTNIIETTTYRQDFPFIGMVASQTRVLGAQTLGQSSNTYEFKNASGGTTLSTPNLTSAPYRVLLSQAQVARNDLNGAAVPTVISTYQYDAYGNATQVTVAAADGFSKTTTNTYSNDTTNWLLGRLTNVTVTSTKP